MYGTAVVQGSLVLRCATVETEPELRCAIAVCCCGARFGTEVLYESASCGTEVRRWYQAAER
eukprot:2165227-Rhodomonas_salina.1